MVSVKAIDALLPQTQCGECGYKGCLPYAEALAQGKTPIDRCPPGGVETVKALGELLAIDPEPYLPTAKINTRAPALAQIREPECIGCTKCIQACPVDAILGSAKRMHAVINTECTGCGLCVEPCPVDCIEMVTLPESEYDKNLARPLCTKQAVSYEKSGIDNKTTVKNELAAEQRMLCKIWQARIYFASFG